MIDFAVVVDIDRLQKSRVVPDDQQSSIFEENDRPHIRGTCVRESRLSLVQVPDRGGRIVGGRNESFSAVGENKGLNVLLVSLEPLQLMARLGIENADDG